MFGAASFNYYLITFYTKYIPGNIFVNMIVASLSEFFSTIITGAIVSKLGPKLAFTVAYSLCGVACAFLWLAEARERVQDIPSIILVAKFGICSAFSMLYMNTLLYFPNKFMGRVFGMCNVFARFVTIMSPMVAEAPEPTAELSMVLSCLLAAILSRGLMRSSAPL